MRTKVWMNTSRSHWYSHTDFRSYFFGIYLQNCFMKSSLQSSEETQSLMYVVPDDLVFKMNISGVWNVLFMIQNSLVSTSVKSNLRCMVLLSKSSLNQQYLYFGLSPTYNRRTTHLRFNPHEFWIHDCWIMTRIFLSIASYPTELHADYDCFKRWTAKYPR